MVEYYTAAICRRGHIAAGAVELHESILPKREECGATVYTECPACEASVRGMTRSTFGGYEPPKFCPRCGTPYPWATRKERFYQLENLLDEEDLDPADELKVREEPEALREHPEADEADEIVRWQTVKRLAPGLMEVGGRIIESVATAGSRRAWGCHR